MKKLEYDKSGFTLIELIIAVCIIGLGILAFMHSEISALSGASASNTLNKAVAIAQSQMDKLLATGYNDPDLSGNYTGKFHDTENNSIYDQTINNVSYNLSWIIKDNSPIQNCKEITTNVSWVYKGENFSISLTNYKANAI